MAGLRIDNVLWVFSRGEWHAICPKHHLPLDLSYNGSSMHKAKCPEDFEEFTFPRSWYDEKSYIAARENAKNLKELKYINLDDEAVPIAEDRAKSTDEKFFVTARIVESKVGQRLVIYAGERGRTEKTQIFVEPEVKRLTFDQKDLNPADVFLKVEAEFADGTKHVIEKKKK